MEDIARVNNVGIGTGDGNGIGDGIVVCTIANQKVAENGKQEGRIRRTADTERLADERRINRYAIRPGIDLLQTYCMYCSPPIVCTCVPTERTTVSVL